MTDGLRPYSDYKDSGLPWLGKVPAHWDVRRNGRLFAERNEIGCGGLPILEVSIKTGVRARDLEKLERKQVMADREKYKRAARGDIAYNMMRMWQGAVGVAPVDGLVSPAYVVAQPFEEVNARYFSYLFRTTAYMAEIDGYSRGIVKDRNRLYWEDFKRMPSCYPPVDEQRAIADFLDALSQLVREFIRNRRRLMEVLNEQKQAIINQAVTRGLDPTVPLKPSGVEWLGDVPSNWEPKRLRFLAQIIYGSSPHHSTYNADGNGAILVNGPDEYSLDDFGVTRAIKWTTSPVKLAPAGALLFCLRGSTTGRLNVCHADVSIGRGVAALVPRGDRRYFMYAMMALRSYLKSTFRGSTFPSVTSAHLNNYWLANPPTREQKAIADWIETRTKTLNQAAQAVSREIELVREYRTRLIADVVTGKLDVRHLAPQNDVLGLADSSATEVAAMLEEELDGTEIAERAEETAYADECE